MRYENLISAVRLYLAQPPHEQSPIEAEWLLSRVWQHLVNSGRIGVITNWLWQYSLQLWVLQYMLEVNRLVPKWPGGSANVLPVQLLPPVRFDIAPGVITLWSQADWSILTRYRSSTSLWGDENGKLPQIP